MRQNPLLMAATSLALALPIAAQSASYTFPATMAPGCPDFRQQEALPFMLAAGLPKLGTTLTLRTRGSYTFRPPPGGLVYGLGYLLTGTSRTSFGPLPLPFDTTALGRLWCGDLRVSIDLMLPIPPAPATGPFVDVPFAIPNARALLGVSFFQQVLHITGLSPNVGHVLLSRASHGVIGR